jgi:hypothetical protein
LRVDYLDLPAVPVPTQQTTILRLGYLAHAVVRRDHLDAEVGQRLVERVSVVGAIRDEPLGQGNSRRGRGTYLAAQLAAAPSPAVR